MSGYLDETRIVWGWAEHPEAEAWQGAGSLEDAVEGAEELAEELAEDGYTDQDYAYIVAGAYPDPGLVAERALTAYRDQVEQMEEWASDNGIFSGDDELFGVIEGAEDALKEALRWWGRRYLKARVWSIVGDPIKITRRKP